MDGGMARNINGTTSAIGIGITTGIVIATMTVIEIMIMTVN